MVENCEVREQNTRARDPRTDSYLVPPSAFTTFYLGMLTNADVLRDDVMVSPCHRVIVIDNPHSRIQPLRSKRSSALRMA